MNPLTEVIPGIESKRAYSAQQARTTLDELGEYAAGRNPKGYAEADVSAEPLSSSQMTV